MREIKKIADIDKFIKGRSNSEVYFRDRTKGNLQIISVIVERTHPLYTISFWPQRRFESIGIVKKHVKDYFRSINN